MRGDTPDARRESAARLAEEVNAHVVIYDDLVPDGESQGLDLEFYLSPHVNDETASIIGPHRLGKPIPLPLPFDTDSPEANIVVSEKILVPGQHIHFFFDSVPPEEAGAPGSGPWQIYPTGPGEPNGSPFTLYTIDQRPDGATQMCILVANEDHSVNQGTGNCADLP